MTLRVERRNWSAGAASSAAGVVSTLLDLSIMQTLDKPPYVPHLFQAMTVQNLFNTTSTGRNLKSTYRKVAEALRVSGTSVAGQSTSSTPKV